MPIEPPGPPPEKRRRRRRKPAVIQLRDFCRDCAEDIPLLTRIASHVGLIVLMVFTIAASNIQFSSGKEVELASLGSEDESPFQETEAPTDITEVAGLTIPVVLPVANIPKRTRAEVVKYTVQAGDTVTDIANQFGVSADSILWANPKLEDNPDMLSLDQVLNIPPTTGVLYTVAKGDTLQKIADKFKTKQVTSDTLVQNILKSEFNQVAHNLQSPDLVLTAGQFLMIPDGIKPFVQKAVYAPGGAVPSSASRGSGNFGWPVSGRITQKYWGRHPGIDVGAPMGTPVYAADSGYVIFAAWDQERVSYGNMILVNHGNGYVTRYAHLSKFAVTVGSSVKKGQIIGRVGSTGNSTGPHLHFEIIKNGVRFNPFSYLK